MIKNNRSATVIGLDTDPDAMAFATARLAKYGDRFPLVKENFADLQQALLANDIAELDCIDYGLGVVTL